MNIKNLRGERAKELRNVSLVVARIYYSSSSRLARFTRSPKRVSQPRWAAKLTLGDRRHFTRNACSGQYITKLVGAASPLAIVVVSFNRTGFSTPVGPRERSNLLDLHGGNEELDKQVRVQHVEELDEDEPNEHPGVRFQSKGRVRYNLRGKLELVLRRAKRYYAHF